MLSILHLGPGIISYYAYHFNCANIFHHMFIAALAAAAAASTAADGGGGAVTHM